MEALFTKENPEKTGVDSRLTEQLMIRILQLGITMHGVVIVSKGKVIEEANWYPFHNGQLHRMYSVSKSFVSLAVGCLAEEGKLKLSDPVSHYFPDKIPEQMHPYLKEATVRDLLMMATPNSDQSYTVSDTDWVKTFFEMKPSHPAGTIFSYDTAGTVVLCTIVERITGMSYTEYLKGKLFEPIQASNGITCIRTPEGTSWGGSGMLCSLYDMAKSAYVCMHHGRWGERQLLPKDYVDAAVSKQIDNSLLGGDGYGYQIWRLKRNGFAFNGMGGQYAYCFPDEDLLFACTADNQSDAQDKTMLLKEAVYEFVDAVKKSRKSEQSDKTESEVQRTKKDKESYKDLRFPDIQGDLTSSCRNEVDGIWYKLEENPMHIRKIRLIFQEKSGILEYENARGQKQISFGLGEYCQGEFPEFYFDEQIGTIGNRHYKCMAEGAWTEERKLYIRVCITDTYLGGLRMELSFKGNQIGIHMMKTAEWFLDDYQGFAGGTRIESCCV